MKTKFGAIIIDGRGKIGGHVASKNRAGSYMRTKVTPVNPRSTSQINARGRFTANAQTWRGLTEEQRATWNAGVSMYAKTDIFGDVHNPSGFNLFQKLNNNAAQIEEGPFTDCPMPVAVDTASITSLTADSLSGALSAVVTPGLDDSDKYIVYATPQMSAGISFVKNQFRAITTYPADQPSPLNLKTSYEAVFGAVSQGWSKIYVKLVPISAACGLQGSVTVASAIVSIP